MLSVNLDAAMANDPFRELFEACKTGDSVKVKKLITPQTVNARDTAGRKSTPLHFAAGKCFFLRCCCVSLIHRAHYARYYPIAELYLCVWWMVIAKWVGSAKREVFARNYYKDTIII